MTSCPEAPVYASSVIGTVNVTVAAAPGARSRRAEPMSCCAGRVTPVAVSAAYGWPISVPARPPVLVERTDTRASPSTSPVSPASSVAGDVGLIVLGLFLPRVAVFGYLLIAFNLLVPIRRGARRQG